jgi:hypothetical protein
MSIKVEGGIISTIAAIIAIAGLRILRAEKYGKD